MSPQKKTGKKGFETEEIIRSYFLEAGFFAIRGVSLRHSGFDLTDIDLWIYERSATFARRRVILDIKDKAQPKAAERLFFVKGVGEVIKVEAVGVVTSDTRPALRELARKHNVLWIDNADIQRLKASNRLQAGDRISEEDLMKLVAEVDGLRSSKAVQENYDRVKSSVADRFGPFSANVALEGFSFFANLAVSSHPNSTAARVGIRLAFISAAIAAASLDFASGEIALRPSGERLKVLTEAIRYGADSAGALENLKWTEAAIREFVPNGQSISEIVRSGFTKALKQIPAEPIAEIVVKMSNSDRLFSAARSLEAAGFSISESTFDDLQVDAKSFVGAALDFTGIDRMRFAQSWARKPLGYDAYREPKESIEAAPIEASDSQTKEDGKLL